MQSNISQLAAPIPFINLEKILVAEHMAVEAWFAREWNKTPPPVYGSIDLRNAGFKLAPVDMNLFPAGFNNLNASMRTQYISAAKTAITRHLAECKKIAIVPEHHTRNPYYWENMLALQTILQEAGFSVRIGTFMAEVIAPTAFATNNPEKTILVEPLTRVQYAVHIGDFVPDLLLLNNDLAEGIPDILRNLQQPILPPAELGWSTRLKSEHFAYYAIVAREFAENFNLDPWLIAPYFNNCGQVNFMAREGEDCLDIQLKALFAMIEKKYAEYQITEKPFVIVKADRGTYGMAVMTVKDPADIRSLNRRGRAHMSKTKGGQTVTQVILQEGVYTNETWGDEKAVAEPVVYLFGDSVIGGFYRVHEGRGVDENLNSPGMHFKPMPFVESCDNPNSKNDTHCMKNRHYIYGVIARLSMLAAARELNEFCRGDC